MISVDSAPFSRFLIGGGYLVVNETDVLNEFNCDKFALVANLQHNEGMSSFRGISRRLFAWDKWVNFGGQHNYVCAHCYKYHKFTERHSHIRFTEIRNPNVSDFIIAIFDENTSPCCAICSLYGEIGSLVPAIQTALHLHYPDEISL